MPARWADSSKHSAAATPFPRRLRAAAAARSASASMATITCSMLCRRLDERFSQSGKGSTLLRCHERRIRTTHLLASYVVRHITHPAFQFVGPDGLAQALDSGRLRGIPRRLSSRSDRSVTLREGATAWGQCTSPVQALGRTCSSRASRGARRRLGAVASHCRSSPLGDGSDPQGQADIFPGDGREELWPPSLSGRIPAVGPTGGVCDRTRLPVSHSIHEARAFSTHGFERPVQLRSRKDSQFGIGIKRL